MRRHASYRTTEQRRSFSNIASLSTGRKNTYEHDVLYQVARELKNNIVAPGTVLEHSVSKDGLVVAKPSAKPVAKWRALKHTTARVVVSALTSEHEHADAMLRETADTLRVLKSGVLKAWRYFSDHIVDRPDDDLQRCKRELGAAAQALAKAAELIARQAPKVAKDLIVMDCTRQEEALMRLAKEARKAAQMVLKDIKMDGATKADESQLKQMASERQARVQAAVLLNDTAEWTTEEYIAAWADLVVKRHGLAPAAEAGFKDMLRALNVKRIGQLVRVDRAGIQRALHDAALPDAAALSLAVWREVNRVRANFWGLTVPAPIRSLWLLVREAFLCLEDLRLGYAILRGDVVVPGYWHTCFRDGLLLLTQGLDVASAPLALMEVQSEVMLPDWDGTRKSKLVSNFYFTDGHSDGSGPRRGKASAEVVAQMVLQIRKDVVEAIGWGPSADDSEDD